ncbi:hypothetical protein K2173_017379 [Erythroxylum novogranatense]|uniref:Protein kinase domain-containing protein n=1 Tax=Erythroxylum novogranatense TaxID=1862640 RepID=A0AAV8TKC8_9ROSI|nr:hypothetical protein K2173_017379 [Erythroxylum novogranatense]
MSSVLAVVRSNFTDESSLLAFKAGLSLEPNNILVGNWSTAINFCNWFGVSCSKRRQRVTALELPSMGLRGTISPHIGNLSFLASLDLSDNGLHGNLPHELGNLARLKLLLLRENRLAGSIPPSLCGCKELRAISLVYNNFSGGIPKELGILSKLSELFLGGNNLGGTIPSSLGNMSNLWILVLAILVVFILFLIRIGRRKIQGSSPSLGLDNLEQPMISYHELVRATDSFSDANLLGVGSFGSVYRGTLSDGKVVAIKVLNLQLEGAFKSFDAECKVLRNVRHRNLVKVISSCSNPDLRALILQYMPNGSLEKWLYSHNYFLNLTNRVNILVDVAVALEYLHHGQPEAVVHCDLKPSNILLDQEMVAHVGDFGISKMLAQDKPTTLTATLGTLGYMAPVGCVLNQVA